MFRKILPVLCAPLAFLVPMISFGSPVPPPPTLPSQCIAQAPAGTVTGARRVSYCYYNAGSTAGQWVVFTIGSWTITVTHAGVPKIVARGSLSDPNMFGSFKTAIGDKVEVAINAICPPNSSQCGSIGTLIASDQFAPAAPPVFPTVPPLPVGTPSSTATGTATPTTNPVPTESTANCETNPAEKTGNSGQSLGYCHYIAKSTVGGWVAATLDSWNIAVGHAGKWTTVAKGSMLQPNPQGSFTTAVGDEVRVYYSSVCIVPGVCGSFGAVTANDRPASTPSSPQIPGASNTPSASPVATPSTGPAPTPPNYCLASGPVTSMKSGASGLKVWECTYNATDAFGQWQVFTIGSWTISVKHAGVWKTVAKGSLTNPNLFGSFPTSAGDVVDVRIYSICTPGNLFCGSVGTILASDRPSQLPATPSFPSAPPTPAPPVTPPSQVPSVIPSTTAPVVPTQCVTNPMQPQPINGAGRQVASCDYIAKSTTGIFLAPTIGSWSIYVVRNGVKVVLASGGVAGGANPEGTYTTKLKEDVTVVIDSICVPSTSNCGSVGFVAAGDE
ncbi:MAG: hypothetical protein ACYDCC_06195 [Actinomycetota bacterium]